GASWWSASFHLLRRFGAADRRAAVARRAGQLGQGCRTHARSGDPHRPRHQRRHHDPGAWRFGLRLARRSGHVHTTRRTVLGGDGPQLSDRQGDRGDRRSRLDPGVLSGCGRDPDTGAWISDAEVAEIPYTAFASTPDAITARLIVRRVKD